MTAVEHISSAPRRRIQPFIVLLAASAIAASAIAFGQQSGVRAQDASASPAVASGEPTALPEGFTRKMAAKVDEIIKEVLPVRQLPAALDVTFRVVESDDFRQELEALFRAEYTPEYIDAEGDLFARLGLIPSDVDLEELILSLYESQVLAFYDPSTTTFSLIGPLENIGALESVVVAHEYGHALQDSAWDLEGTRVTDLDQADTILAQQALAEGDATALMYDWAARELKLGQLLRVSGEALTKQDTKMMRRIPPILRRQLEFPYIEGYAFVNALRGRGDWAEVDAAWDARPVSTEQVIHPELYPDELPVQVDLPDVAAALGPDWQTSYEQTLGEMQIGVWVADGRKALNLFPKLPGQLQRQEAAAGWGGDRLVSLDGPDGSWVVAWQTAWDTPADAKEFRKAARDAMKDLPGAHVVSGADIAGGLSSPVLVLVADSDGTLGAMQAALGVES
jgi:hypothetical protein